MRTILLACALCACGGNNSTPKDASVGSDGPVTMIDAGPIADASDAGTSAFAYCIDRPDNPASITPRPPTAGLSCDLLPPPFHQ